MAPMEEDIPVDELDDAASDEDFNPDEALQDEDSSSSEDETLPAAVKSRTPKGKRRRDNDVIDAEFDSGDEATIQERRNKKRKGGVDADLSSDGEGGQGGFVRTRAQRLQEKEEQKPLATIKGSTIDVDAVWAKLSSKPVGRPPELPKPSEESAQKQEPEEGYITIKRTTKFAGEVTTEERRVPKSSAEARLYLEEQERENAARARKQQDVEQPPEEESDANASDRPPLRRPLKRPSRFEPNPLGEVRTLPSHLQLRWPRNKAPVPPVIAINKENFAVNSRLAAKLPTATKLNVVDKSRHDWAGFVDKEGIAEELDEYGRSKQSYLSRRDFLERTEQNREAQSKEARMKGSK